MMSGWVLLSVLLVTTGVIGFKLDQDRDSQSHWEITEKAILNVTAQACQALARDERRDFTLPETLTANSLLEACAAKSSARDFAINKFHIKGYNALVNINYPQDPSHHFDDESFDKGKQIITDGLYTVKANIMGGNYAAARSKLGETLHTLQDFYSHSNWIEMGNRQPNTDLFKTDASLKNKTAEGRPTCRDCTENCTNNILEDILSEKLLTSGYFSLDRKPKEKCSHGDRKSHGEVTGGINKDSVNSSHGQLHTQAAQVATAATSELLDNVLAAVEHKNFLRMMGVSPSKALCLVIDTTGSMGFDIEAVKSVANTLITNLMGTANEPSVYILVPFNDPGFGPVNKTTDLAEFKKAINALVASGGGDEPEMSLSGLQLALNAVPPGSEIYVFTDATAKDAHLTNSVITLIKTTQCVVNFVISKATLQEPIYSDMAKVSGGKVVKVSKGKVNAAITVLLESSYSNLVTLFQAIRNPGTSENFIFSVDETETNLLVFITGTKDFTLISPSGAVQETTTGSLTTSTQTVGNLLVLKLKSEAGQWKMNVRSTDAYTLNIMAQSLIDFFFSFMTPSEVRSNGYAINTNKPPAGTSGTMMVVLFGSNTTTLKEVNLVYSSGSGQLRGNITGQENNEYLVQFDNIPFEEFTVQVKLQKDSGLTRSTSGTFQRQSTANIKASFISVTSNSPYTVFEQGSTFSTNVTISTKGAGNNFTIRVTNNPDVGITTSPSTVEVLEGSSANFIIQTKCRNTTGSTVFTQTVEASAPGALDPNYAVSTLTVMEKVTDIQAPVFEQLTHESKSSDISTSQQPIRVTDDTAIVSVYVRQGNGTLQTNKNSVNETIVYYNASSRSPIVEIVAVDGVDNVGTFLYDSETRSLSTTPQPTTTTQRTTSTIITGPNSTATEQATSTATTASQPSTTTTITETNTTKQTSATTTEQATIITSKQPSTTTKPTGATATTRKPTSTATAPTNNQQCVVYCLCLIMSLFGIQVFN